MSGFHLNHQQWFCIWKVGTWLGSTMSSPFMMLTGWKGGGNLATLNQPQLLHLLARQVASRSKRKWRAWVTAQVEILSKNPMKISSLMNYFTCSKQQQHHREVEQLYEQADATWRWCEDKLLKSFRRGRICIKIVFADKSHKVFHEAANGKNWNWREREKHNSKTEIHR